MQSSTVIRVLFVDDNQDLGNLFRMFLEGTKDFIVHSCTSASDGLKYLSQHQVDAVISDYSMPEMDGLVFLREIRRICPDMPFIMLTGEDSKETAIEALNTGADFYQNKGDELDIQIIDIAHKVHILVAQREAERAVQRKDAILEAINYAADQFLKGSVIHIDSHEILSRLGSATGSDMVYLYNIRESKETGAPQYDIPASWARTSTGGEISPARWPERWHEILTTVHHFVGFAEDIPDDERELLDIAGIRTIIILPIYANRILCGYLVFIDQESRVRRSAIEIQTLRMAAELIGSARYRKHIEEFYKCPVEEAILGIFLLCGNELRYVNPRISTMFGYQREELLRITEPLIIIHQKDRELVRQHISRTLQGNQADHHIECTGVRKDGTEIFLDVFLTPIKCQGTRCIAGNIIDITDRKIIQQSLWESEQRYRRLAEQLDDLIIVIDPNWLVSYGNPSAASAFPHTKVDEGTDIRDILQGAFFSGLLDQVHLAMQDGSIQNWSMEIHIPEQGATWYDISITPLKVDDGGISSIIIYFHDVTYRVRREEEIRRAGLAQLELNMEQFQILNDEIRNPLQVIKGYNLLQSGDYAEKIETQLIIINDLIDKLDRAWVQSEKVHKFLLRHYEHGSYIGRDPNL